MLSTKDVIGFRSRPEALVIDPRSSNSTRRNPCARRLRRSARRKLLDDSSFHEPQPLSGKIACEAGVFDQYAHLDVPLLRALREVGARYERPRTVDDDALRV